MKFVATEKLKPGMRLAKPIYNRTGVLLYDRNTKLNRQGIVSIKNFKLIGVYILEPAEPLPPMTEEDIAFERFQTMGVFSLRDAMEAIVDEGNIRPAERLADEILRRYANHPGKITFTQNLRSPEDNIYKHSLNTAILAAAIYSRLASDPGRQKAVVMAALLHDLGLLELPERLKQKRAAELTPDEQDVFDKCRERGHHLLLEKTTTDSSVTKNIAMLIKDIRDRHDGLISLSFAADMQVEALKISYYFDELTAMKIGDEPKSDIEAYTILKHPRQHLNSQAMTALSRAVKIVPVGCCVSFTNGDKGIVLTENEDDILRPFVLSFRSNKIYNLAEGKVYEEFRIADVLKTMDNRYIMTDEYEKYKQALKSGKEKIIRLEG
ncbi:MAG: HD domain-containing protein [Lachnospiraceae bacterium]|nr:HD domain-containing protein [Lachnospiraceae bacterium]